MNRRAASFVSSPPLRRDTNPQPTTFDSLPKTQPPSQSVFSTLKFSQEIQRTLDAYDYICPTKTQRVILPLLSVPRPLSYAIRSKPSTGKFTSIILSILQRSQSPSLNHFKLAKPPSINLILVKDGVSRLQAIRTSSQLCAYFPDVLIDNVDLSQKNPGKTIILIKTLTDLALSFQEKSLLPSEIGFITVYQPDSVLTSISPKKLDSLFNYLQCKLKTVSWLFIGSSFSSETISFFQNRKLNLKVINVTPNSSLTSNLKHFKTFFPNKNLILENLNKILKTEKWASLIVNCDNKNVLEFIFGFLIKKGISFLQIKKGMKKEKVKENLEMFLRKKCSVLLVNDWVFKEEWKLDGVKYIVNVGKVGMEEYWFKSRMVESDGIVNVVNFLGEKDEGWCKDVEREYGICMECLKF